MLRLIVASSSPNIADDIWLLLLLIPGKSTTLEEHLNIFQFETSFVLLLLHQPI
jgi:hypothetical protein